MLSLVLGAAIAVVVSAGLFLMYIGILVAALMGDQLMAFAFIYAGIFVIVILSDGIANLIYEIGSVHSRPIT